MDLSTTYLGLNLANPFMTGASPLVDDLDMVRRLEDSGAAAIVMHSLFEEQITLEELGTIHHIEVTSDSFPEALNYFPRPEEFHLGPDMYLEQIRQIKEAVRVPVIASLNGVTVSGWLKYAKLMQQAGADALELNTYYLAMDPHESSEKVEHRTLDIVAAVKKAVSIPVSVKLSPYYSSLGHFAAQLDQNGVDGLVLFNRFYQPDIDIENLEVLPTLHLSDSSELLLRLRWLAILSDRLWCSLSVTGGVHTAADALKSIMAGAHSVQLVSVILKRGPEHVRSLLNEMKEWLEVHEYESLAQARGSMRLQSCPEPSAFERANYMKILQSWKVMARSSEI